MKKIYLAILLSIIVPQCLLAQTYPGYRNSNYTGVNGVFFNPANIADSRYKFDINLFSVNGFVGNDQASLGIKDVTRTFNSDSLKRYLFGGNKPNLNSLINTDFYGPSVMFNASKRTAIAITTRARVFSNARNIDGSLAQSFIDGGSASSGVAYPTSFTASNSVINAAAWSELGFSLSTVFSKEKSMNCLKGGFSVKYLSGTANAYLSMNSLNGTVANGVNGTYLTNTIGNIDINTTDANLGNYQFKDFFKFNGHGIGVDLGLVYEFRPNEMTKDNNKYVDDRFDNKYKLKVGVALLDVGNIKFEKSAASSASYSVNIPAGQQFLLSKFKDQPISNYKPILDTSAYFVQTASNGDKYTVVLPTTLQVSADYNINDKFFVTAAAQMAFSEKKNLNLYAYNSYTLSPRFETRSFGVAVPVNYNDLTHVNVGLSLRAGPFFVGSGSFFTALFGSSKQADIHTGFHIGIPYKKVMKPDTDADGFFDDVDKCPTVFGIARYGGCPIPDTDGDSINDEEDKCPTAFGLAKYAGCPIPDTDGDGINDEMDKCPTVAGTAKYEGCPVPDTDGDGINDEMDKCPTVAGIAKYNGCPPPDTDGDGVNDDVDVCPNEAGPASSKGCPPEKIAVQITAEFTNVLFDFGKATIRPESLEIIVRAAKVMNEEIPNSTFYIDGYTDNVGSAAANKTLSRKRAQSVADALVYAGIEKSRIMARGLGKDNPKCDNKTKEGQQCNRRVEVTIRNINQKEEKVGYKLKN
jgi:outer membrane protein OmpA-like peptidoglycan-associated protein